MLKKSLIFTILFAPISYFLIASPGWKIDLLIKVKGSYEIRGGKNPIEGEYFLSVQWKGGMEKDNSDYLLYKDKENQKIIEWRGKEIIYNLDDFHSYEEIDLSNYPPPKLNINYLLKKEDMINLDLNFSPLFIPHFDSEIKKRLLMPSSAQNELLYPHFKYNKNIIKGSNEVCFKEQELYAREKIFKKNFWEWKKVERTFHNSRLITFMNSHSVELELQITLFH